METVTTVTGDTVTVEVTVAMGFRSDTTVAFREREKRISKPFVMYVRE